MPRLKRTRRKPNFKRRRIISLVVTAIVVFFAIVLGTQYVAYSNAQKPVDINDKTPITVEIPQGYGIEDIGTLLKDKGIIRDVRFFALRSTIEGMRGKYKAGIYEFTKSMSSEEIMSALVKGIEKVAIKFTIPEGLTLKQTMAILVDAGLMTEDEFWNEVESGAFDYKFLEGVSSGRERLEGFLYPETYEVYQDAGAHEVIDKMLSQFDALFTQEKYDLAAKRKMTVREIVTIASLIERETSVNDERPKVARVIYNRIKDDMKLQIDATIQYLLPEQKLMLTTDDLDIESDYNTYLHEGLPPGPICSPRMASIDSALNPVKGKWIYYVLDPALNGMHRFTENYEDFLSDKAAYQEAMAGNSGGDTMDDDSDAVVDSDTNVNINDGTSDDGSDT